MYIVITGKPTFLNPYAATKPDEFFVVLSEYLFTMQEVLKNTAPVSITIEVVQSNGPSALIFRPLCCVPITMFKTTKTGAR